MIALDTNILVRLLVEDDAEQTAAAKVLLTQATAEGSRCYVSAVVLCELVWVLAACYRLSRSAIQAHVGNLLRARQLRFDAPDRLRRALAAFHGGRGDFADYLIREDAIAAGYPTVATFDRALLQESGFLKPWP